jgi:hypothetical protein
LVLYFGLSPEDWIMHPTGFILSLLDAERKEIVE